MIVNLNIWKGWRFHIDNIYMHNKSTKEGMSVPIYGLIFINNSIKIGA